MYLAIYIQDKLRFISIDRIFRVILLMSLFFSNFIKQIFL